MTEIIDLVFAKTSPKRSFCMTENERFGLVFVKTESINSGTGKQRIERRHTRGKTPIFLKLSIVHNALILFM